MSTPAEMMGGGGPPGGMPQPGAAPGGGEPGPGAAPTMTPQEPKGEQASADAGVQVAIRMLEHSLVAHGAASEKGKAITRALGSLVKAFGADEDKAKEVLPAELQTALMAPGGGGDGGAPPGGAPGGGGPPAGAMQ